MWAGQSASFGLGLLLTGMAFLLLVGGLIWLARRARPGAPGAGAPALPIPAEASKHALLLVRVGGRAEYLNPTGREWFGLQPDEPPNLEVLARRVRPVEAFMDLCLAEGQARLTLQGRPVEAISYYLPLPAPAMLVSLRRAEAEGAEIPPSVFQILSEFNQSLAAHLDLENTLRAILAYVERLLPADALTLQLWNPADQTLTPYQLIYDEEGNARLERGRPSPPGHWSQEILKAGRLFYLPELPEMAATGVATGGAVEGMRSFAGVPLRLGEELLGTLEISLKMPKALVPTDLEILQLIAAQAAAAIRNATLFEAERRRSTELSGLAELAQAIGETREPQDLFTRLVHSIAPLLEVEILGFLLYDEDRHVLAAQPPFVGLPSQTIAFYQTTVEAGSALEETILAQQAVLSENAMEDERWQAFGLQDFARAASLRDTALIPLVSGGRLLGFLQASNHRQGATRFSPDELRFLNIVANQAAQIIDNLTLLRQSRQRAQRAEALRRIVSLVNSSATVDEILRYALQELARLLQVHVAAIFLLDEAQGVLRLHRESFLGASTEKLDRFARLLVNDALFAETVTAHRRSLLVGRATQQEDLPAHYRSLAATLKLESLALVPLVVRERGIGEVLLGHRSPDFFNNYDVQMLMTAAGQLAGVIESAAFEGQTDESLRRQIEHLRALVRISHQLHTIQDVPRLLQVLHEESLRLTGAECGVVMLCDGQTKSEITLAVGENVPSALSTLERQVLVETKPLLVEDFSHVDQPRPHNGVGSAIMVPIMYRDQTSGLVQLHASRAGFFTPEMMEVAQSLAVQAAIALENAARWQEREQILSILSRRSEALPRLVQAAQAITVDRPLEQSLAALAAAIRETTPFDVVLISLVDAESGTLQRVAGAGIPPETLAALRARPQPFAGTLQMFRPDFKLGGGYFVPAGENLTLADETPRTTSAAAPPSPRAADTWHAGDALLYPLQDDEGNYIGLISLDAPRDGKRPDSITVEAMEVFASQAALLILAAHRLSEYRSQVETLTTSLARQQQILSASQAHLPVLLRKDLEYTIAVRNLERRARRIRAGLEIAEAISLQVDAQTALQALGREILTCLEMNVSMVAENTAEGPRLLHVLGSIPRSTSPEALFGQRNPLRYSLQTGETLIVTNLEENDTWRDVPLLTSLHAKSFLCLPVLVDEKPVAGVLAISLEPLPALTEEDQQVYLQISRQVSIILQNINLLAETRRRLREVNLLLDFSRQLSGLEPESVVNALLDSALRVVTGAHAGMVLIWDAAQARLVTKAARHYANSERMLAISYGVGEALPGRVFAERRPRRVDEVNFAREYNLPAEYLLYYREATGGRLPVSTLLVPIQTAEAVLGVLVLDNFNTVGAFNAEDEAILLSLAQQVALSLENVNLIRASQERARQLQALTAVAASMSTSLQSTELIAGLLDQLGAVLRYDTAILWLRSGERMTIAAARGFPDPEERIGLSVDIKDSLLLEEMIRTGQGIVVGNVRADPRFPALAEAERLSWMGVPMISKGQVIGVIALEKSEANYFTFETLQLAGAFASQAAVSLENAHLYEDSLRRAAELDERSQRLALLNRLSYALSGSLDEDQILRLTGEELWKALSATRLAAVTLGRSGETSLRVVLPSPEKEQPAVLPPAPIFERLRESLGIFVTEDVSGEPDLAPLMDGLLTETRSLLILPLASGTHLRALFFVQMAHSYRFSAAEIELARTICNQAAIALENARLYQSTVATAERLATINRVSYEMSASLDPEEIYAAIHRAAAQLMPAESFVISLLDEATGEIEGVYLMDPGGRAPAVRLPPGEGLSGHVIASGQPLLIADAEEIEKLGGRTFGEGQPRSIVAVPIMLGEKVIGMLSAQSYRPNVYTEEDQQVLSILANQAAVAIQNGRLFAETRRLAEELEQRVVERTAELAREQRNTETLLRILTEASSTLDIDRALNRTLALLNEAIGAEQSAILMVNPTDNTLHYRVGYGYVTPTMQERTRPTPLKVGEGLGGWVIKHRKAALVDDVRKDSRWVALPMSSPLYRSVIAVPLVIGEDVIGAVMAFHRQVGYFTQDHLNLVQAIGTQVSVAINNAQLYELIRDQAERLGGMLRVQQVEASRQQAILEAVADGVLVTDASNMITFVNPSAERLLGLENRQIVGRSLEQFVGLFGRAAQAWMNTIRSWSENPSTYQVGDTYAEQLTLDNGRVILVHLAPVIWRNDFLGTVSVFRDITHEVEVDRLKSEFVATVSHELRTPMTSIKGYVDLLLMGAAGALSESQIHFLEIVRSNTERLSVLVNDLLDISRIEAGRISLSFQPLDLRAIAEDVIADLMRRSQEENKPMAVSLEAEAEIPTVRGDPERVRQILDNLVSNAYHYTPANGKITILIHTLDETQVQVDVQDNGIGIPPSDQERIFERFFRGENPLVLATPGTGLGLSIVQQLVQMHGGRIWVESTGIPGEGSTFSFTLPVYRAEE